MNGFDTNNCLLNREDDGWTAIFVDMSDTFRYHAPGIENSIIEWLEGARIMKGYVIAFNMGQGDNVFALKSMSGFSPLQFWGEATMYNTRDEAMADAGVVKMQFNPTSIQIYHISDLDQPGNPMVDRKETVFGPARDVRYR
jgi:hypothetical protein